MAEQDKRRAFYDAATQRGVKLGDYDQFSSAMDDSTKRRKLYDAMTGNGKKLGTYEQFDAAMGGVSNESSKGEKNAQAQVQQAQQTSQVQSPTTFTPFHVNIGEDTFKPKVVGTANVGNRNAISQGTQRTVNKKMAEDERKASGYVDYTKTKGAEQDAAVKKLAQQEAKDIEADLNDPISQEIRQIPGFESYRNVGDAEMQLRAINGQRQMERDVQMQSYYGMQNAKKSIKENEQKDMDAYTKWKKEHPILAALRENKVDDQGNFIGNPLPENSEETNAAYAAYQNYKDAQDMLRESRKGRYMNQGSYARNALDASIRGLGNFYEGKKWELDDHTENSNNLARLNAVTKFQKGEELSKEEEDLVESEALNNFVKQNYGDDVSGWYNAMDTTQDSLRFMSKFLIFSAMTGGVGGTESAITRFGLRTFGKKFVQSLVGRALKTTAADLAYSAAQSAVMDMPSIIADTGNRMVGEVTPMVDKAGNIVADGVKQGESFGTSFRKAATNDVIENYSEMLGEHFGTLLNPLFKGAGKALSKTANKLGAGKLVDMVDNLTTSGFAKALAEFEEKAQWHGLAGEWAEEMAGGTLQALTVGDQKMSDVWSKKNMTDTLFALLPMCGFTSAIHSATFRTKHYQYSQDVKNAASAMDFKLGQQSSSELRDMIDSADTLEDQKKMFNDIMEGNIMSTMTNEQKVATLNYIASVVKLQSYNQMRAKQLEEGNTHPIQRELDTAFQNGVEDMMVTRQQRVNAYQQADANLSDEMRSQLQSMNDNTEDFINYYNSLTSKDERIKAMAYMKAKALLEGHLYARDVQTNEMVNEAEQQGQESSTPEQINSVATESAATENDFQTNHPQLYTMLDDMLANNASEDEISETLAGMEDEEREAAEDFIAARKRTQGLQQGAEQRANTEAQNYSDFLNQYATEKEDGSNTVSTGKYKGQDVFVLSVQGDAAHIVKMDGIDDVVSANEVTDINEQNVDELVENHRQQALQKEQSNIDFYSVHNAKTKPTAKGMVLQNGNVQYVVTNVDGNEVTITPGVYSNEAGGIIPKEGAESNTISMDESLALQDDFYNRMDQQANAEQNQQTEDETENNETENSEQTDDSGSADNVGNSTNDSAGNVDNEQDNQQNESTPSFPLGKDGQIDYASISEPKMMSTAATQEFGENAADFLDGEIEEANKIVSNPKSSNADRFRAKKRIQMLNEAKDILGRREARQQNESSRNAGGINFPAYIDDRTRKDIITLAKKLGLNIKFQSNLFDKGAKVNALITGNEVIFDAEKGEHALKFLVGHELTHRVQELAPEEYAKYKEAALRCIDNLEDRINELKRVYDNAGINISDEQLEDELVADFAGGMYEKNDTLRRFIDNSEPSILDKIAKFFREIASFLNSEESNNLNNAADLLEQAFNAASNNVEENPSQTTQQTENQPQNEENVQAGQTPTEEENVAPAEDGKTAQPSKPSGKSTAKNLRDLMRERNREKKTSSEAHHSEVEKMMDGKSGSVFNEEGELIAEKKEGQPTKFSISTWQNDGRECLKKYLDKQIKAGSVTKEEAKNLLDSMDKLTKDAKALADGKPNSLFGQWSYDVVRTKDGTSIPVLHALKNNSEYSLNIDFSTVCKKRQVLDFIFNKLIRQGNLEKENLSPSDVARINQIIQKHGLEIACAICFVDARRYNAYTFANGFLDKFNPIVASLVSGKYNEDWTTSVDNVAGHNYSNNGSFSNEGKADPSSVEEVVDWETMFDKNNKPKGLKKYQLKWNAVADMFSRQRTDSKNKPKPSIIEAAKEEYATHPTKTVGSKKVPKTFDECVYSACTSAEEKMAFMISKNPKLRKMAKAEDFIASEGWTNIMQSNEDLEKLWNIQKGASGARANEGNVQYQSDVLGKQVTGDIFDIGGYRMQSFSDFIGHMYFDYLQAFADLAAKQLPGHAYTKEPAFVKLFGLMGMKINMSLVSMVDNTLGKDYAGLTTDANGNIVYYFNTTVRDAEGNIIRQGQTFPPEEAFALENDDTYTKNAGTIAVGLSKEHILRLLRDPNIRMVIPYHKSGLPHGVAIIYDINEINDYTDSQNTKGKNKNLNDAEKKIMHKRVDQYNFILHQISVAENRNAAYNALYDLFVNGDASKVDMHKQFNELYSQFASGERKENYLPYELSEQREDEGFLPKVAADIYKSACERWDYEPKFNEFANEHDYYKVLIDFSVYDKNGHYTPQEAIHFEVPKNVNQYIAETLQEDEDITAKKDEEADPIIEEINNYLDNKELRAKQDEIASKPAADVTEEEKEFMRSDVIGNVGDPKNIPSKSQMDKSVEGSESANRYSIADHKQNQLDIIQNSNPMLDDIHTGIRSLDDIKTYEEAVADEYDGLTKAEKAIVDNALKTGKVKVYSSNGIENGNFVTTNKQVAQDYAGDGKVNEKEVDIDDVAWISFDEGQMAKTAVTRYSIKISDEQYNEIENRNNEFNSNLSEHIENEKKHIDGEISDEEWKKYLNNIYEIGNPSDVLKYAGVEDYPIKMLYGTLELKSSRQYISDHPYNLNCVYNLVKEIQLPVAVFDSEYENGRKVVLTQLKDDNGNDLIIIIGLKRLGRRYNVLINSIISLYGKNSKERIAKWFDSTNKRGLGLNENLCKWADTKKAFDWLANNSSVVNLIGLSNKRIANIIKSFEDVQVEFEKKLESSKKFSISSNQRAAMKMVNPTLTDEQIYKMYGSANEEDTNIPTNEDEAEEKQVRYSIVSNPDKLKELNGGKKIKVYRAMQLIDGKLYPPMAGKINGKWVNPIVLDKWEQADEHPELATEDGYFKLNKGNGSSVDARYNPYLHTSRSPLNDQFSSAWNRPELVTVEVEVPESELTSGYKAEKAKNAVGEVDWKSGPVAGKLPEAKTRKVILTRYDKPVRVIPNSEVAEKISQLLEGENLEVPFNTVTPELRNELVKHGVKIGEPQKGNAGKASQKAYEEWKNEQPTDPDNTPGGGKKLTENQKKALAMVNGGNEGTRYSIADNFNKALELGDQKKAKRILQEIAGKAMPNTKVVDKKGLPKIVYHGTVSKEGFNEFEGDIWLSSKESGADQYTHKRRALSIDPITSGRVMPCFVNIENPYIVDANKRLWDNIQVSWSEDPKSTDEIVKYAKENGYDGVIIKNVRDNIWRDDRSYADDIIAFNPSQVKSTGAVYEKYTKSYYPWDTFDRLKQEVGNTYDDEGNVIPLEERFNNKSNDIRYSISDKQYMDAVSSNDIDKAEELVEKAAKKAGYTMKAYHGTDSRFNEFFNDSNFFALQKDAADAYANAKSTINHGEKVTMPVYINPGKSKFIDAYGNDWFSIPAEWNVYSDEDDYNEYFPTKELAEEEAKKHPDADVEPYGVLDTNQIADDARKEGYDSVIIKNVWDSAEGSYDKLQDDVVVFDQSRIKSADAVTYDDNGNVVPLSERFNDKSKDIRYSIATGDPAEVTRNAWDELATSARFQLRETMFDYLTAVEKFQDFIAKENNAKVMDFQNAYYSLLALSSRNKSEMDAVDNFLVKPLNEVIKKLTGVKGKWDWQKGALRELQTYVMAKHGIERNREMAVTNALKEELERRNTEARKNIADPKQLKAELLKNQNDYDDAVENWYTEVERVRNDARQNGKSWITEQAELDIAALSYGADLSKDYSGFSSQNKADGLGLFHYAGDNWDTEAHTFVVTYESHHEDADIADLWEKINALSEFSLAKQNASGLSSADYVKDQKRKFEFYVPLRNWDSEIAQDKYDMMGSEIQDVGNPMQKARGRKSAAGNPFGSLLNIAYRSISTGNKNLAVQKFYNLVSQMNTNHLAVISETWLEDDGNGGLQTAIPNIPANATEEEISNALDQFEKDMIAKEQNGDAIRLNGKVTIGGKRKSPYQVAYKVVNNAQLQKHQVNVYIGGVKKTITITGNNRVAEAINGLTNPSADTNITPAKKVNDTIRSFMAGAFTSNNMAFSFRNISRDTIHANNYAFIMESPKYWWRFTKNQKFMVGNIINLAKEMKFISAYNKGTLDMNNKEQKMFKEFLDYGGATGYTYIRQQDEAAEELLKMFEKKSKFNPLRFFELTEFFGNAAELSNRFAAYKTSREMGRSISRSISDAKEITLNFNRKGSGIKTKSKNKMVNTVAGMTDYGRNFILFFNANMQSRYQLIKMMEKHPVKTIASRFVAPAMFFGMCLPILNDYILPAIYSSFGGGDDGDDDKYFDTLTDYERAHNICLRMPNKAGWIKIPLSPDMVPMTEIGDIIGAATFSTRELGATEIPKLIVDLTSPVSINWDSSKTAGIGFAPTATQPLLQLWANTNFMGSPIYKESFGYSVDPQYKRTYKRTSETLKSLSKILNKVEGGDDFVTSGALDINPASVEHIITSYTGGYGSTMIDVADGIYSLVNAASAGKEEGAKAAIDEMVPSVSKYPVIKDFTIWGNKNVQDDRISKQYNEVKYACKELQSQASKYKSGYKEAVQIGDAVSAANALSSYNKLGESVDYQFYMNHNAEMKFIEKVDKIGDRATEQMKDMKLQLMKELTKEYKERNNK